MKVEKRDVWVEEKRKVGDGGPGKKVVRRYGTECAKGKKKVCVWKARWETVEDVDGDGNDDDDDGEGGKEDGEEEEDSEEEYLHDSVHAWDAGSEDDDDNHDST